MPIVVHCGCGAVLRAPNQLAGKKASCPTCMAVLQLPDKPTPESRLPRRAGSGRVMAVLLLLALLPLAWEVLHIRTTNAQAEADLKKRINEAVESDPHAKELARNIAVEKRTPDNMLVLLPGHRLRGAWLARDTKLHWAVAGAAAMGWLVMLLIAFPRHDASVKRLVLVGLFTSTIGVAMLIALQFLAVWALASPLVIRGPGIVVAITAVLKFIGLAYYAAMDPASTGSVSLLGFTMGVGMCEEMCKALPLLWHYRNPRGPHLSWIAACAVGLISGAAFGIAEGIMYSHTYYNGVEAQNIYIVRFISCVALHSIWTGAVAIAIQRRQDLLQRAEHFIAALTVGVGMVIVPMLLHGVFDTLLKRDLNVAAVGVAVVSVMWLAYQMEMARRTDGDTLIFA